MSDYKERRQREKAQRAQQLRQDYREVQALYQAKLAQGMSQAQAATSQVGDYELAQSLGINVPKNYTVKAGDTIATISQNTGVNPQDILAANPDVTQIQTGMVLQTPPKKTAGFGGSSGYPTLPQGQPANPVTSAQGALNLGSVKNNQTWLFQQHNNQNVMSASIPVTSQRPLRPGQREANALTPSQTHYIAPVFGNQQGGVNPLQPNVPSLVGNQQSSVNPLYGPPKPSTVAQQTPLAQTNYRSLPSHQTESRYVEDLFTRTQMGYTPNQGEMNYLIATRRVSPTKATGGNYFSADGRYRVGGGRGHAGGFGLPSYLIGSGHAGDYAVGAPIKNIKNTPTKPVAFQNNNLPAFSSGAGFGGLVNWRI